MSTRSAVLVPTYRVVARSIRQLLASSTRRIRPRLLASSTRVRTSRLTRSSTRSAVLVPTTRGVVARSIRRPLAGAIRRHIPSTINLAYSLVDVPNTIRNCTGFTTRSAVLVPNHRVVAHSIRRLLAGSTRRIRPRLLASSTRARAGRFIRSSSVVRVRATRVVAHSICPGRARVLVSYVRLGSFVRLRICNRDAVHSRVAGRTLVVGNVSFTVGGGVLRRISRRLVGGDIRIYGVGPVRALGRNLIAIVGVSCNFICRLIRGVVCGLICGDRRSIVSGLAVTARRRVGACLCVSLHRGLRIARLLIARDIRVGRRLGRLRLLRKTDNDVAVLKREAVRRLVRLVHDPNS
ncbi:hypothetical protein EV137_2217 [Kribbella pratensis]|uniref:Uncharacterized protein n=1 Tax=Kribbella pratensis TaxID=2512112 RepID=A0ABY2FP18_9ACTN|nr:hypothetical protein [Kribbella pratensis]TDW94894.1 hypothetical protein EV137_2217 [Kribbella pratensis]